jgi:hypothetical protein
MSLFCRDFLFIFQQAEKIEKNDFDSEIQGCQIFLGKTYQKREKNIQNSHKIYQIAQNIPNGNKKYQIAKNIPNGHKIYQHLPFQDPPKFTQIGIFWFENMPSGNPPRNTFCLRKFELGVDAMIALFAIFSPIFGEKMAFFSKITVCGHLFLHL